MDANDPKTRTARLEMISVRLRMTTETLLTEVGQLEMALQRTGIALHELEMAFEHAQLAL
jgi:hypothetical protein